MNVYVLVVVQARRVLITKEMNGECGCVASLSSLAFLRGPTLATCSFTVSVLHRPENLEATKIQTRIVGVEGEDTDHLTTITSQAQNCFQNQTSVL